MTDVEDNVTSYTEAKAAYDAGHTNEAIAQFERLVKNETSVAGEAAYALGVIYETRRAAPSDVEKALDFYSLAERAGVAEATQRLGASYRLLGQLPQALEKYKAAAVLSPSAAYWTYRLLRDHPNLSSSDEEAEGYLKLALQGGHLQARKVICIRRIKGDEGISGVFGGIVQYISLFPRFYAAAWRGESDLLG